MNVLHSMPSIQISVSQYLLVSKVTKKLVINTIYPRPTAGKWHLNTLGVEW